MQIMASEATSEENWDWAGRYVAGIVVALILATGIGGMDLFTKTMIGSKLSAGQVVRFLGYGTALAAFWMLGQRLTVVLGQRGGRWAFVQHLILPLVSLGVIAMSHTVLLLVLGPLLNASLLNIYNWVAIAAILACAVWVVLAVLGQSSALTEVFASAAGQIEHAATVPACPSCGAACGAADRFCGQCGKALDAKA
jgi:hypothetical protein